MEDLAEASIENAVSPTDGTMFLHEGGGGRLLRPGVSTKNFLAFLFAAMVAIAGLVFINADQSYVMVDILDYPRNQVGKATGTLVFVGELLSMVMVSVWGALSDRIARRWIFSTGLALMGLGTALHPWATCVFPNSFFSFFTSLLGFRLLFAMGGSASTAMLTALIGDYSRESSRAKVAGITGFSTGLGALLSAMVLSRIPTFFTRDSNLVPGGLRDVPNGGATLVITFALTGGLLFIAAIIAAMFLRAAPGLLERSHRQMPLSKRVTIGITAIVHPLVALAYASGFVARGDSIALILFIPPWVDRYMVANDPNCSAFDPKALTRCPQAKRLSSSLMGIAHTAMLIGAPIFGILSDRLGPVNAIIFPAGGGLLAFGMLFFLDNPRTLLVYFAMALAGFADIGMIISSMALMAAVSTPQHRGALAGVYSFFGALGIIANSTFGGYLLDNVRETASFLVVATSSGIVFIAALAIAMVRRTIQPLVLED
jgi:MFS family permease